MGVRIVQQRPCQGRLLLICECAVCRTRYRLATAQEAAAVITALRRGAEQDPERCGDHAVVAERILSGYTGANAWS